MPSASPPADAARLPGLLRNTGLVHGSFASIADDPLARASATSLDEYEDSSVRLHDVVHKSLLLPGGGRRSPLAPRLSRSPWELRSLRSLVAAAALWGALTLALRGPLERFGVVACEHIQIAVGPALLPSVGVWAPDPTVGAPLIAAAAMGVSTRSLH